MKNRIKSKGFTLIELLVVISVIGLLAAVVLISMQRSRIQARDLQQALFVKAIFEAVQIYHVENGTFPAVGYLGFQGNYHASTLLPAQWQELIDQIGNSLVNLPQGYEGRYSVFYEYLPKNGTGHMNLPGVCLYPGSMGIWALISDPQNVPRGSLYPRDTSGGYNYVVYAAGNFTTGQNYTIGAGGNISQTACPANP
jgi:prepilin-type N-terminal cleavage/methylation domain-containing protein